jgi:hypothetical protein
MEDDGLLCQDDSQESRQMSCTASSAQQYVVDNLATTVSMNHVFVRYQWTARKNGHGTAGNLAFAC